MNLVGVPSRDNIKYCFIFQMFIVYCFFFWLNNVIYNSVAKVLIWLDGWMDGWGWLVINIKVVYKLVYLKKGKSRQLIKLIIVGHTKKDKCNWVSQSSLGSVCGGTKVKLKLKLKLNMIFFYISTSTTHTRLLPTYSICFISIFVYLHTQIVINPIKYPLMYCLMWMKLV